MRRRRAAGYLLLAALSVCGVLVLQMAVGDPTSHILARRSSLDSWIESSIDTTEGYRMYTARLRALSGVEFDLAVKWPMEGAAGELEERIERPRPLVLVLGGQHDGHATANLISDTKGAIVAAISYPHGGRPWRWGTNLVSEMPRIRSALLDTPGAIMLALDYLDRRGIPARGSVDLVGISLGVPFVCIAAALDDRFDRVWSIHGAGEPYTLLEHNLDGTIGWGPARKAVAGVAAVFLGGPAIAPERWVGRISPRPFIMINATEDQRIPRRAVLSLYLSAQEPKEIRWMPGDHINANSTAAIHDIVDMIFERVVSANSGI